MNLDTGDFFEVRDSLIDQNLIAKAMGQGGASIYTAQPTVSVNKEVKKKSSSSERDLYDPLMKLIHDEWAPNNGINKHYHVMKTAERGKKDTGGKWSRPDITIVAKRTWVNLNESKLEVITFEVKPIDCLDDITGVYETASHSMFAHYSYLMLQYIGDKGLAKEKVQNVSKLCRRFGIGLILFSDPSDIDSFINELMPDKKTPYFDDIEYFLSKLNAKDLVESQMLV